MADEPVFLLAPESVPIKVMQEALQSALEFAGLRRYALGEEGHVRTIRVRIMRGVVEAAVGGIRNTRELRIAGLRNSIHCCFVDGKPATETSMT